VKFALNMYWNSCNKKHRYII